MWCHSLSCGIGWAVGPLGVPCGAEFIKVSSTFSVPFFCESWKEFHLYQNLLIVYQRRMVAHFYMVFKLIPTCPGLAVMLDVWGPPGMGPAPEVTGVAVTGLAFGKPMVPGGGPLGRMPGWGCCWPGCCWGIPCCGILTTPGCWGMLIPGRGPWGPPTIWGAPGGPGCCCCWLAGQIINYVTFCWLFTIMDQCK